MKNVTVPTIEEEEEDDSDDSDDDKNKRRIVDVRRFTRENDETGIVGKNRRMKKKIFNVILITKTK